MKNIIKTARTILISFSAVFLISFVALAWDPPQGPPPTENVPAPLNTGDRIQTKEGSLGVGGALSVNSRITGESLRAFSVFNEEMQAVFYPIGVSWQIGRGLNAPVESLCRHGIVQTMYENNCRIRQVCYEINGQVYTRYLANHCQHTGPWGGWVRVGGSVTSVGLTMPTHFSVTGSPVTTSGTLTASWNNQTANRILAGPASGSATSPTFRSLVAADIPNLDASKITSGTFADARIPNTVVRTSREINTGIGLTGGGNLTANRTLSLDTIYTDNRYVNKAGDTMTGNLYFSGATRYIGTSTNHQLRIRTNNTDRITILAGGDVGIGITSPNEKLHVDGNVRANAFYYTSDIRLKENIGSLQNSLSRILELEGISYKLKDETETKLGFSAQQVKEIFPELVKEDKDGTLSLDAIGLIAPLIEAMKEQQEEINTLKEKIEFLTK